MIDCIISNFFNEGGCLRSVQFYLLGEDLFLLQDQDFFVGFNCFGITF